MRGGERNSGTVGIHGIDYSMSIRYEVFFFVIYTGFGIAVSYYFNRLQTYHITVPEEPVIGRNIEWNKEHIR